MNILQLTKKNPFPAKDGESIAIQAMSKALLQSGWSLTRLIMNTKKHYQQPKELEKNVYWAEVDTSVSWIAALVNLLFSKKSYNITRFYDKVYEKALIRLLEAKQYDVVHLEGTYLLPYVKTIREYSSAKISLRLHNIESKIWKRLVVDQKGVIKWYYHILAKRLERFEKEQLQEIDLLVPISTVDEHTYRNWGWTGPSLTVPLGIDVKKTETKLEKNSIYFLGALDWLPNQQGLTWFMENVWQRYQGNAHLYVAGRNMPKEFEHYQNKNTTVKGEVDNAYDFIRDKEIMIVPLFAGSGIRIKIIEAMTMGKVIISTSIGAEGIEYTHGEDIIIADTAEKMLEELKRLSEDEVLKAIIRKKALETAQKYYNADVLANKLSLFYKKHIT